MYPRIKNTMFKGTPFVAALFLSACGGGGSSSSTETPPETSIELSAGGYYTEIAFSDGSTVDAITLLSSSGKFVTVVDFTDITVGNLSFGSTNQITGSGTDVIYDGTWQTIDGTITGTAHTASSATIKATAPGYESTVTLTRDDAYSNLGVSLDQLSGTYIMSSPEVYTTSVTVASDGTVTGNDETGCVFNGQVTIPNGTFNVYEVSYTASNCADTQRNGQFFGLGAYDPSLGEIEFAGSDGEVSAVFIGTK